MGLVYAAVALAGSLFGIAAPSPWREVHLMHSQEHLPMVVSAPAEIDVSNATQLRAALLAATGLLIRGL